MVVELAGTTHGRPGTLQRARPRHRLVLLRLSAVLRLLAELAIAGDRDVVTFGGEREHDLSVHVETVVAGFEIEVLDDCTGMDVRSKPEMLYNGTACAP